MSALSGIQTSPAPALHTDSSISLAPRTRADLTCEGVQSGCSWRSSAAAPPTWGVAIEVPLMAMYPVGLLISAPSIGMVETMFTPGAERSGLMVMSGVGPRELNDASAPLSSTAPTVTAYGETPGDATVFMDGPELPAATTTTTPASTALWTAMQTGSPTSPCPPRLMLMTSTLSSGSPSPLGSRDASMAAMTSLMLPMPSEPSDL